MTNKSNLDIGCPPKNRNHLLRIISSVLSRSVLLIHHMNKLLTARKTESNTNKLILYFFLKSINFEQNYISPSIKYATQKIITGMHESCPFSIAKPETPVNSKFRTFLAMKAVHRPARVHLPQPLLSALSPRQFFHKSASMYISMRFAPAAFQDRHQPNFEYKIQELLSKEIEE